MGGMLEKPVTKKESDSEPPAGALRLSWASSCMQGWRTGMEDAHITMPSIKPGASAEPWTSMALFGVLDGHGGEQVAKFSSLHLAEELRKFPLKPGKQAESGDLEAALRGAFHKMDDMLRDTRNQAELNSLTNRPSQMSNGAMAISAGSNGRSVDPRMVGCTACVCCVTEQQLVVANAGDSRAVLCRGGKAVPLSEDHKPNNPGEKRRIEAAGGYVENSGPGQFRVNGNLNLSRALGDLEYKKDSSRQPEEQIICSTPDVTFIDRDVDEDEFLVICCDGVWDVKTNQEVVDFLRERLPPRGRVVEPRVMEQALEGLLDACVSPDLRLTRGLGGDNMTAVIVMLVPPSQEAASPAGVSSSGSRSLVKSPDLLRVRLLANQHGNKHEVAKAATNGARQGWIEVHVGIPAGLPSRDVSLGISEDKAQIEVVFRDKTLGSSASADNAVVSEVFDLRSELPKDAVLQSSADPAKMSSKSGRLRLSIPWQLR
eukprot:gb/GFBE01055238.1/.p1 GENE.gb/GFBE01055238.1/~~gb/GFBE01055238.1/.p1  ORF type:complete len:486 (+),score=96.70 gb/GFBE01055238.1/:1-1458(+)